MQGLIDNGWAAGEAARAVTEPTVPPAPPPPAAAAEELVRALLDFDSAEAHAAIDRVFAARTLDGALRDVVLPVLREVGEGWEHSAHTVAQEHYATELLAGRLRGLAREWDNGLGPRAVLACPPGERHDIGLLCCGLALHRRGWRVTYLGPDTPVEALAGTVGTVSPALVVIGVLQPGPLHDAAPELAVLAEEVAVVVMFRATMSTLPSVSTGIRWALVITRSSILFGSPKIASEISFSISMSKPSIAPVTGLRAPSSTVSAETPAISRPRCWMVRNRPAGIGSPGPGICRGRLVRRQLVRAALGRRRRSGAGRARRAARARQRGRVVLPRAAAGEQQQPRPADPSA